MVNARTMSSDRILRIVISFILIDCVLAQPDTNFVNAVNRLSARMYSATQEGAWHMIDLVPSVESALLHTWPHSVASGSDNTTSRCTADLETFAWDLLRRQPWAISMADAAGKLPTGVLRGNFNWLGSYKECLNTTYGNRTTPVSFSGNYCSLTIGNATAMKGKGQAGVWLALRWDVCIPNSCTNDDIARRINSIIPLKDVQVILSSCDDGTPLELSAGAIGVICMLSVIGAVIVVATCYDIILSYAASQRDSTNSILSSEHTTSNSYGSLGRDASPDRESTPLLTDALTNAYLPVNRPVIRSTLSMPARLLLSFSITANAARILTVGDSSAADGATLHAIHGIRFLSMSWVILGHTWAFIGGELTDLLDMRDTIQSLSFQAILNASVSVDTFFLLSGTLMSYLLLREIKRCSSPRNINWGWIILGRYLRLTPMYMILLGVSATLFIYWGDGPYWMLLKFNPESQNCRDYWWANLLYVNNIVGLDNMCFGHSWYLANDMQFFLLSLVFVVLLYQCRVVGLLSMLITACASWITVGVITYVKDYPPSTPGFAMRDTVDSGPWFDDVYWVPWARISPYLVGVTLGYVLYRRNCKVKMHVLVVIVGWCLAAVCNLAILYGLYNEANGHDIGRIFNTIYGATHRTLWSVGVAWVIFACVTGYGGPVNMILSWNGFVPLSRLTYAAYLVHPFVILWVYYNAQAPYHATTITMTIMFCGILFVSYGVAFIASVALEAPVINLLKLSIKRRN